MINGLSFDIEDWFQVENMKSAVSYHEWDRYELRVANNTQKILRLLKETDTKATFFILGWVAEKCPELVKEIDRQGHEVASHGYSHRLVYQMSEKEFLGDLQASKCLLEDLIKKPVLGYRAPSFSITRDSLWALDMLKKAGFTYDSSIFPVQFHDRYGFSKGDGRPYYWPNGLFEIPLAVYRVGNINLPLAGGGYFRLFPYSYFKYFLKKINCQNQSFTFYLHPWELDPEQPKVELPLSYRFRHYVNLGQTEKYLKKLLEDFLFERITVAYQVN